LQEDIENRSIAFTVQGSKLTGRVLKSAALAVLRKMEKVRTTPSAGRNSMKRLMGKDGAASSIPVSGRIRSFERIARKYKVAYHIRKEPGQDPPKWQVFFRAPSADALTAAFKEYTRKETLRDSRPSLLAQLHKNIDLVKNAVIDRVKNKEHGGPER